MLFISLPHPRTPGKLSWLPGYCNRSSLTSREMVPWCSQGCLSSGVPGLSVSPETLNQMHCICEIITELFCLYVHLRQDVWKGDPASCSTQRPSLPRAPTTHWGGGWWIPGACRPSIGGCLLSRAPSQAACQPVRLERKHLGAAEREEGASLKGHSFSPPVGRG